MHVIHRSHSGVKRPILKQGGGVHLVGYMLFLRMGLSSVCGSVVGSIVEAQASYIVMKTEVMSSSTHLLHSSSLPEKKNRINKESLDLNLSVFFILLQNQELTIPACGNVKLVVRKIIKLRKL